MYPTPSPTESRESTCEPDDSKPEVVDHLNHIVDESVSGAIVYLGAFLTSNPKQIPNEQVRIHHDQIPPPPKTWK